MSLILNSPRQQQRSLADGFRNLRMFHNMKRETLAERSGVSLASVKRFETEGEISLKSLLKLALCLGTLENFTSLFPIPEGRTLDELEALQERVQGSASRKRARK